MALHDFRCSRCRYTLIDHDVPIALGARLGAPRCPTCDRRMTWIPAIGAMDAGSGASFKSFEVTEDVRGALVTHRVDSLHDLRRIERDHEQLARNGEGRPLVWRDYSNSKTNGDVHTLSANLGDPHGVRTGIAAHKAKQHAAGTPVARRGAAVTAAHGTVPE